MTKVPTTRGRPFANGNGGRKPGSKNRSTLVAAALLDGEAEKLLRKAIEVAMAGDIVMLKFLLGRVLPRERLITFDLPHMDFADDAVEALELIMRAVSEGQISVSEGAGLATLVKSQKDAITLVDVVRRLDSLDAGLSGTGTA